MVQEVHEIVGEVYVVPGVQNLRRRCRWFKGSGATGGDPGDTGSSSSNTG